MEQYITPFKVYALYDGDENRGQIEITSEQQEEELQNKGYGIFWTVNEYEGARKVENATKINYWFCDIDGKKAGSKENMLKKLSESRIKPSHIIETKNGFHCYWKAKDATKENWKIIEKGLIERFNADPARSDITGLLRKVYSAHLKDINNPYCIRYLFDDFEHFEYMNCDKKHKLYPYSDKEYKEKDMLDYFAKEKKEQPKIKKFYAENPNKFCDEANWERLFDLKNWGEGNRNKNFARIILWLKDEGLQNNEIEYIVNTINHKGYFVPLPESEIRTLLRGKRIVC